MATVHETSAGKSPFPDNWPEVIETRVWVGHEDGYFFALSEDFDIIGQGATQAEALWQMAEMAMEYLHLCARDGYAYEDTLRRVPFGRRAKLRLRAYVGPVIRRFGPDSNLRERSYLLPVSC